MSLNSNILLAVVCLSILAAGIQSSRVLQKLPPNAQQRQKMIQNERNNQANLEDPFSKKTLPEEAKKQHHKKGQHRQFPSKEQTQQIWGVYEPFEQSQGNEGNEQEKKQRDQQYNRNFNQLLKWGLLAGSAFMAFVLIKTCIKKRGRRQMRRFRQGVSGQMHFATHSPQVFMHQAPQQVYYNQPIVQQSFSVQTVDEKIKKCQMQLNKLKQIKQEAMKEQFNRKKNQEEQRKIQMINLQRRQNFQQSRKQNNFYGYGPNVYGQNCHYAQSQNQVYENQPFKVQGIQPIPVNRQRSNSFKTQVSEQPILKNQIKYRNGIPIGKPVRQRDNDSSFASEYPEV